MALSKSDLEDLASAKADHFKAFLSAEPPACNGEMLLELWEKIYDDDVKNTVVETITGPSDEKTNRVFPYEKFQAIVGNGGNWKWPRMWQKLDELERRGPAYREGEKLNFQQANKNPNLVPQRVLVVGGGPVGLRLSIELVLGGHQVVVFEKRREKKTESGEIDSLGFTNRINRPHMWPFVRNDLAKLNGKDFLSRQAAYPVFTEPETSSIGIDELQILLMKNALLLGVDFRLGVSYDNAAVLTQPKSMRPYWQVDCTYDEHAAAYFKMPPGKNTMTFDILIGCDGPRSTVRDTQAKLFGNIEKRKFMDCVGIVANVRKVPRQRLKDLGFAFGQEPNDMNRTKMVFREFFEKIKNEADAEVENVIYYKASFQNYIILTPKRSTLEKHNLSGKVYHFAAARGRANNTQDEEKQKLKTFCTRVLKAAGIPLDPTLPNDGFVEAPNDCMAFDFAECWNTKTSIVFNYPPPDYDVDQHGPWGGDRLIPFVGLCGDALLEPFWPMGLGLKRGWQAIMDTCYAIDNLYNRTLFAEKKGKEPDRFSWTDHYAALSEQISQNFEFCTRLKVAEDLGAGEYSEKGAVMMQLRKVSKDAPKPLFEVEIDPWTRYQPLEKETGDGWKLALRETGEKLMAMLHPKVKKVLAMKEYYDSMQKRGGAQGEIEYVGKKLLSINGKVLAVASGKDAGYSFQPHSTKRLSFSSISSQPVKPLVIVAEEVARKASEKRESLSDKVYSSRIDDHVRTLHSNKETTDRSSSGRAPSAFDKELLAKVGLAQDTATALAHVPPAADGVADSSAAMWDRMQEKHLTPAQEAELTYVRQMIASLGKSLDVFKEAEKQLLLNGKVGSVPPVTWFQ